MRLGNSAVRTIGTLCACALAVALDAEGTAAQGGRHGSIDCGLFGPHRASITCREGQEAECYADPQIGPWCIARCRCRPARRRPPTRPAPARGSGTYTERYAAHGGCGFTVYTVPLRGGTVRCGDWHRVGVATSSNWVPVTVRAGEGVMVRVVEGGAGPCDGNHLKHQATLQLPRTNNAHQRFDRTLLCD